jgi:hypothetical protein
MSYGVHENFWMQHFLFVSRVGTRKTTKKKCIMSSHIIQVSQNTERVKTGIEHLHGQLTNHHTLSDTT